MGQFIEIISTKSQFGCARLLINSGRGGWGGRARRDDLLLENATSSESLVGDGGVHPFGKGCMIPKPALQTPKPCVVDEKDAQCHRCEEQDGDRIKGLHWRLQAYMGGGRNI